MQIDFPDIGLSQTELRLELAVALFQQQKISLGKAAEIAGVSHVEFQQILAERNVPLHYDLADLDEDIRTLDASRVRACECCSARMLRYR